MNHVKPPNRLSRYNLPGLILILLILIAAMAILAWVPPVSRDALTQHLTIPQLYINHGGLVEFPHLRFSYYPMNLDLLYLIPLLFGNDILPKYIHFSFALITALLIYGYLKPRLNVTCALLGSIFFLSLPIIVRLSGEVYVDLGLICFSFAGLLSLLQWAHKGFALRHLVAAGVFCGLALGTKYNGLIVLLLLTAFTPILYIRLQSGRGPANLKALGAGILLAITAMLVFSPWMIRNHIWTGNPIYPLYDNIINPEPPNPDSSRTFTHFLKNRATLYHETGLEIALVPVRIFFQGKDNSPRFFDGRLNPFLFLLPWFAFLPVRKKSLFHRTDRLVFLIYSLLIILLVFFQKDLRIRHISPVLPPLVILAMLGLHRINVLLAKFLPANRRGQYLRRGLIVAVVVTALGMNAAYIVERFQYVAPLDYLSGKVSRDEYIQKYRPEYAAMRYANRHLSAADKILGVYLGNRGYYCDIKIIFDLYLLQDLAAETRSAAGVAAALDEQGLTHLLLNLDMFNHYAGDYSSLEKQVLQRFFGDHTERLYAKDGHALFKISSGHGPTRKDPG